MVAKKNAQEKQNIAFEERVSRLQEIVNALEQGNTSLAQSIDLYKEGLNHTRICREELEKARHEIQVLTNTSPTTDESHFEHASSDFIAKNETKNSTENWENFHLDEDTVKF